MSASSKRQKDEWDSSLAPFMNTFLENVKTKQAAEVGRRAVDYFRGADFRKWVTTNASMIEKKFPKALDGGSLQTTEDVDRLGERLLRKGFIYKAAYKPLSGTAETTDSGEVKRPKWPKRLQMCSRQVFDETGFYVVLYEGSKTWRYIVLGLIITAVLLFCMFPAWPLCIKIGVWYASVFFTTFIMALVFGRLVVFMIFWFFGVDFWILPNLFDEEAGVLESFLPFLMFERRKDDWMMFAARIFCSLLLVAAIYKLQQTHSAADVGSFAKQSLLDVLDWGHQKLAAVPANKPKYPSLSDIEEFGDHATTDTEGTPSEAQTENTTPPSPSSPSPVPDAEEDFSCLAACGYNTNEELLDCLTTCQCVKNLEASRCYPQCPEETRQALDEAKRDACFEEGQTRAGENGREKAKEEL